MRATSRPSPVSRGVTCQMIETKDHKKLVDCLKKMLRPWRKFLICIDGLTGVGKSGLARYLSLQLDMPCIETDLFIMREEQPSYRYNELKNVVLSRLDNNRPTILEGILLLDTLSKIGVDYDYLIYVHNSDEDTGFNLKSALENYQMQFSPKEKATLLFNSEYIVNNNNM